MSVRDELMAAIYGYQARTGLDVITDILKVIKGHTYRTGQNLHRRCDSFLTQALDELEENNVKE